MVDPFWHKVQDAYRMVMNNPDRSVEVEQDGMKATVRQYEMGHVTVVIEEIPTEPPTLISPQ